MKRKIGMAIIVSSIAIWLIDRFSSVISNFLAKIFCGDRYIQAITGTLEDKSCGFNGDMYLVVFLFVVLLIGIILVAISKK